MRKSSFFLSIILLGFLAFPSVSWGLMSSTNYTIFADSIDSGGILSTSGTYSLQDTAGESPVGFTTSSTYTVIGGFQAMDFASVLTISIDTATIDLGTLSVSAVATSSAVVSVTAEASTGYVLSVASVSGTSLSAVSDGTVSAGTEEYGVAVNGPGAAFSDDRAITAGLNLSSSGTSVTSQQTTLTFKASMSSASVAGGRSQSVILTASTNI
ncbi:MAG: Uncharacterized protein G01um101413_510 [Parcubacteria group bacterium Gr01-1014_13]|nr:MAG: Uncharacterized protein G01um101413_510 [Parcubacteria group bacterium Gr01-1014_13]